MTKQRAYFLTSALLLLCGILPLQLNAGTIPLLLLGALLLSSGKWTEKWRKRMLPLFVFCICFGIGFLAILGCYAYGRQPSPTLEEHTVIVLGCKVNGDRPSRMLQRRLDTASTYLKKQPSAACIVSGGQGWNEDCTEASVMKNYLVAQGIAPERIYTEEAATNTLENLRYSKAILEEEGLSPDLVIISDGFHQFRSRLIAAKLGLRSFAVSANTDLWLVPCYAVREVLSLMKLLPFFLS